MNWQTIEDFLNQKLLENTLSDLFLCIGILLFGLMLRRVFVFLTSKVFYGFFSRQSSGFVSVAELVKLLSSPLEMLFLLIIIYIAFIRIHFPDSWNLARANELGLQMFIEKTFQTLVVIAVTRTFARLIDFFATILIRRAELTETVTDNQLAPFIREVAKVFLFIFAFLFMLGTVFRLDVASIVAGLGIGGLAVALAGKESLENLFASFTIFLDKPFVTGNVVKVGNVEGVVEKVGFRSTRIRTSDMSFLTIPNKMMVDQPLDNLSSRRFRRAKFNILLSFHTSLEKIRTVEDEIRTFIATNELTKTEPPFVYFNDFNESSLGMLVIYFVETADWVVFMEQKEKINFKIMEIMAQHDINFAVPAREVFVQNQENTFSV
ncbi:MAG: mechanosensitive ion channel family protein [Verrucomicrobia bacterium]|nr:mechanosensitive ion channel family protein [Cytophagales bacterium]